MASRSLQVLLYAFLLLAPVVQSAPEPWYPTSSNSWPPSSPASNPPGSRRTTTVTTTVTPTCPTSTVPATTSTTSLPTPTPSGACLNVNPLCAPQGFDIDYYFDELGGYSNPYASIYSNYYIVDGLTPLKSSLTNITYFPQNQAPTNAVETYPNSSLALVPPFNYKQFPSYAGYTRETNGGIVVDANNFTLVYSGFFRPPTSGLWQICSSADNENDIYFGDGNAFACGSGQPGTADDPIVKCSGGNFNNAQQCAKVTLTAGFFYPFRSVMANWQGPSAFEMTMVAPGQDTSAGSHDFSGYAYPNSCGIHLTL